MAKNLVIYVPCSWESVPRSFFESFLAMTCFDVQKQLQEKYDLRTRFLISDVFPLDRNRNEAIEMCINLYKADYMLFIDADMLFPKDTILRLFERISDEFPVVCGNYHLKHPPHRSVCGHYIGWEPHVEKVRKQLTDNGLVTESGQQCLFYKSSTVWDSDKPFQVDVGVAGCLLVDIKVFQKLQQPYFKYFPLYDPSEDFLRDACEGMAFCAALKKVGIKMLVDPRVQCSHLVEREITFLDQEQPVQSGIVVKEPIFMEINT